ncbi:MAG: hypothetical protein OJF49_001379 [Ktedonobacterales bacterium]|nr:MAG: hypothetical protein OJF49_001379 [Ktedonobacterales bacterium]
MRRDGARLGAVRSRAGISGGRRRRPRRIRAMSIEQGQHIVQCAPRRRNQAPHKPK